uniref:RRM domain-containing protein n=1 Tax=Anguilla anguilla TaxID=7936 RepID=A0A0E9URK0_ANGAN
MDPNTGRSRGFGFILFKEAASVEKVSSQYSRFDSIRQPYRIVIVNNLIS